MISKKVILLIEDNEDIRESIAEILELEGFHVLTASCGGMGVSLANLHIPDLVICDIVMCDMDGYTVYDSLRIQQKTKDIPFIFSTAKSENSEILKANSMGVVNYLIKPFNDHDLMKCVDKCLKEGIITNNTIS